MNSRERVLATVRHEQPDRCPMDFWVRSDVTKRLAEHLGLETKEDVLRHFGIDLRVLAMEEHVPGFADRATGMLGGTSESSGMPYILHEDGRFENAWGVQKRIGSDGAYDEWVSGPFVADPDLDAFDWPPLDIYDPVSAVRAQCEAFAGYATMGRLNLPFKMAWHMRGFENFLCDMMLYPDYAAELLRRLAAYELEKGRRLVAGGCDILGIYGDLAMQDRMLVQPEAWRAVEKPILTGMVQELRAINPDLIVFFHSDGDITEIIPDYLEIGADILNPIQPECMDPAEVKRRWGDRVTIHGAISIQRTLPRGTPDDVRAEVRERIDTCGRGGGLILCPSNLVQNDTPLENIVALYEADRT